MKVPKETSEIFDRLRKGGFICSNAVDAATRRLYEVVEKEYDVLSEYFWQIGFDLEQGNEFFYFSRLEPKDKLKEKIAKAYEWIDIVDFFKTYKADFDRFTIANVVDAVESNPLLKDKLDKLRDYTHFLEKRKTPIYEIVESIVESRLKREQFVELENEISKTYKVLSSFEYMENLINLIQIQDEAQK